MWYSLALWILLFGGPTSSPANGLDLSLLKRDTQVFERIVSEVVKQNFTHPFAFPAEPEGVYLNGYGVVVSFHLNINRSFIRTPFGDKRIRGMEETRSTEEQIQILRTALISCLADYGITFKQLTGEDRIAVSAHVEDRNELDPSKNRTIVLLSVSKSDVERYARKEISLEEFKRRVESVLY